MKNTFAIKPVLILLLINCGTIAMAQEISNVAKMSLFSHYFRAGLMTGVMTSRLGEVGTLSLRTEYGLSNKFSVIGDLQAANGNTTLSGGQGSIAMRYQPLNFGRFQPYITAGFGMGSVSGEGRHCHNHPMAITTVTTTTTDTTIPVPDTRHHLGGIGLVQFGTNFRVSSHFVASAEGGFQTSISRHPDPATFALRMGLSYQFGK